MNLSKISNDFNAKTQFILSLLRELSITPKLPMADIYESFPPNEFSITILL